LCLSGLGQPGRLSYRSATVRSVRTAAGFGANAGPALEGEVPPELPHPLIPQRTTSWRSCSAQVSITRRHGQLWLAAAENSAPESQAGSRSRPGDRFAVSRRSPSPSKYPRPWRGGRTGPGSQRDRCRIIESPEIIGRRPAASARELAPHSRRSWCQTLYPRRATGYRSPSCATPRPCIQVVTETVLSRWAMRHKEDRSEGHRPRPRYKRRCHGSHVPRGRQHFRDRPGRPQILPSPFPSPTQICLRQYVG
jgi:hypothetical protein